MSNIDTSQLPQPKGFYLLVQMRKVSDKIGDTGLFMPESRQKDEEVASPMAEVVLMGPECYQDQKVFPSGPRCKVGDVVLMAPYAGQRFLFGTWTKRCISSMCHGVLFKDRACLASQGTHVLTCLSPKGS